MGLRLGLGLMVGVEVVAGVGVEVGVGDEVGLGVEIGVGAWVKMQFNFLTFLEWVGVVVGEVRYKANFSQKVEVEAGLGNMYNMKRHT